MTSVQELAPALSASVGVALTEGAFLVTFPVADAGPLPAPTVDVEVTMTADGRAPLRLEISLPSALAREVAANVLGEFDPASVSDEDVLNSTLELANVVAGGFARHAFSGLCKIASPRPSLGSSAAEVCFTLGTDSGSQLRVGLGVDRGASHA
jgi:hypothetical protein